MDKFLSPLPSNDLLVGIQCQAMCNSRPIESSDSSDKEIWCIEATKKKYNKNMYSRYIRQMHVKMFVRRWLGNLCENTRTQCNVHLVQCFWLVGERPCVLRVFLHAPNAPHRTQCTLPSPTKHAFACSIVHRYPGLDPNFFSLYISQMLSLVY